MSQKIKQDINIGEVLRKYRKKSNFTQEQVVAHMQLEGIDISRSIYSQIECGTYNIKVSELIVLVNLFKCDFNALFMDL